MLNYSVHDYSVNGVVLFFLYSNNISLFKMADVKAGYLKVKLDLLKRWHPKYARKRIQH